ncbi:hypothetical protein ACLB90_18885 [Stenotrophomonas sp. LGBM10]|uniref:hypothetical protein n=1 Tax=Stenotrophomonas sp. LGBM10 TaxID=3390038 RepID=UPI00398BB70D
MKHFHAGPRRCGWAAALLLAAATGAHAQAAPEPLRQLDFPVLARGETGQFRVLVPAHGGGEGAVAYAVHAVMPGSGDDLGYRFPAVSCPEGFKQNVHADDRGVVCHQSGGLPHPAFTMTVTVRNVEAADGETRQDDGLRSVALYGAVTHAPWFLYGVRP